MYRFIQLVLIFIGISGSFSVLFGAWLAHAGLSLPEPIYFRLVSALQYQVTHTLALLILVAILMRAPSKLLMAAGSCWLLGILFFSGSLFIKTYTGIAVVGKLAPIGGMLMSIGWLFLIPFACRYYKQITRQTM